MQIDKAATEATVHLKKKKRQKIIRKDENLRLVELHFHPAAHSRYCFFLKASRPQEHGFQWFYSRNAFRLQTMQTRKILHLTIDTI